jgi:hypothetical protein
MVWVVQARTELSTHQSADLQQVGQQRFSLLLNTPCERAPLSSSPLVPVLWFDRKLVVCAHTLTHPPTSLAQSEGQEKFAPPNEQVESC